MTEMSNSIKAMLEQAFHETEPELTRAEKLVNDAARKVINIERKYIYGDQEVNRRLADIRTVIGTLDKDLNE